MSTRVLSFEDAHAATSQLAGHLRAGGLIAYPTETVYGFGCALQPAALAALRALKSRDAEKPFLLLVTDLVPAPGVIWTAAARDLAEAFWPGPLTLALRVREGELPRVLVAADDTVAVRHSPHPVPCAIIDALGEPITSTSANRPGAAPALNARDAADAAELGGAQDVIVVDGGELPASEPSTIVSFAGAVPRIVRSGAISRESLRQYVEDIQ